MFFSILVRMKKRIQVSLFACLFFAGLSVGKAEITIQLVDTFRYRAEDDAVITVQMNDSNMIVGSIGSGTAIEGFYVRADGRVSAPFHEPEDTVNYTIASGINNDRVLCGYYGDGVSIKGFVRMGERYVSFVAPVQGLSATHIYSINDADNFVGSYDIYLRSPKAFAVIDGVYMYLGIPGAVSEARGINNLNQIVGDYSYHTIENFYYGFFRDSDGSLMNVVFPGAQRTKPMAINDAGFMVGSWDDGVAIHGCLIQLPSTFISYDVPGAANTMFTGINNNGTICGIYWVARELHPRRGPSRGFIAQIQTDK
jgi:uncharacterized membrane protein